ncbi:phytoene desaturase [Phycisphaerae bacterium]|jgi:diapolycopene oxygenase|nr:phytoene desaturase [Phycisphaerae bacterium]
MAGAKVIVIGGGLAGLSSAVELSTLGAQVTLIERNQHLGGKMNVLTEETPRGRFTFDMGPTIITLPQVLRGIIRRSGRKVEDYINLINLDPQWRCMYENGKVIDLRLKIEEMKKELNAKFPGTDAADGYAAFVNYSRRMMHLSEKVFYYRDLGGVGDMMKKPPTEPGLLGDVMAMRMYSTVADTIGKYVKEPHVRQMCEHFLQYVGSSPFLAPAILSLIAAAQVDHGCWYAMSPDGTSGGTRCVARTLERIVRENNINVITGVGVKKLETAGNVVTGVILDDGRALTADAVVSNCDIQRTYRDLLATPRAQREQKSIAADYTPACSGVVFYLGLDRQYDHFKHHDFLFSKNSHDEFNDIYAKGIPARDPTLYLAVPSRTDPTQAPKGCEALYILIHTPYMRPGQRWEGPGGLLEQYRPVVMDKMKRMGCPDIEHHIVVEKHLTPQSIDRMYNAEGGAIYGLASHGKLKGGFKPKNRSRVFKNMYLAGGSANPGPGVPMVLMSGVTAARSLGVDFGLTSQPMVELGQGIEV